MRAGCQPCPFPIWKLAAAFVSPRPQTQDAEVGSLWPPFSFSVSRACLAWAPAPPVQPLEPGTHQLFH